MNSATALAPAAFTPPLPRGAIVASIAAHAAALLLLPGLQRSADDVELPPIIASLRLVAPIQPAVQAPAPASVPATKAERPTEARPHHVTEAHHPAPIAVAPRPEAPAFTIPAAPQPAAAPERIARSEAPAPQAPALAPAAPQLSTAQENLALDDYGRTLSDLLARQQQYPRLAALRGWEGEVRLRLKVARKGNLVAVQVVHSSGHEILDQHALQLVQDAALPTPPSALGDREIQVVVPIQYKLQKPT